MPIIYNSLLFVNKVCRMQRLIGKVPSFKDLRGNKVNAILSKNKKDQKLSSSKNTKSIKGVSSKVQNTVAEPKIKPSTCSEVNCMSIDNDYGVNPYYTKHKVKASLKKQQQEITQNIDYGTFNTTRDALSKSHYEVREERPHRPNVQNLDYAESAFQKIKLPSNKGLINAEGKFVSRVKSKQPKNQSFHNSTSSKQSFSLNFNSRQQSRYRKKGKSKSKSKNKLLEEQKSFQYKIKSKSSEKVKDHQSYFEKSRQQKLKNRQEHKPLLKKLLKQKQILIKDSSIHEIDKVGSINSKTTSISTQNEAYSALCLTQNNAFIEKLKDEIMEEVKSFKKIIRKSNISETILKERFRSVQMLSRICGALNVKRQAFFLAVHYLDTYISQFSHPSTKLLALGCLTLALKMDDAQMITKFCFHYLYNPEKTVKKNRSTNQIKLKQKRESVVGKEEIKSKLEGIINVKISEDKKVTKQDFTIQEVLDCENHVMMKLSFKLMITTVEYWINMLTAIWDSYVGQFCPKYADTLIFRNDKSPLNLSYVAQMVELECISLGIYSHSQVSLVMAAIYLVTRISLQNKKEETPWEQICRFYRASLSKTTNLIFCDGVGINILFGDFLTLFELSMTDIIECVQLLSKYLQPNLIHIFDYRRQEGLNRQGRITTYISNQDLYKNSFNGTL